MSESVLLTDDEPVDPDDELLVAYLDDELDDAERKAVEKRLVAETEFQRRLQTLQTGWEWLDELPSESNNEKLVESTIELLVADIIPEKQSEAGWVSQHWRHLVFVALLVAGFAAGAIGVSIANRIALSNDLAELAIAEDHEAYKLGDNFSFFYQLAYNPRWQNMIETMEQVGQREMAPASVVASIPLQDRDAALQSLPTETREKLVVRWEAYRGYSEETKQELRRIANEVRNAKDSEKLLQTMKAASVWIESVGEELRDDLQSTDEAVRQNAIDLAIDITMNDLARDSGKLISEETSDRIYLWLQLLLKERLEQIPDLAAGIERGKAMLQEQGRDDQWAEYFMLRAMVDDRDWRGRGSGSSAFGGGLRMGLGGGGPRGPGGGGPGNGRPAPAAADASGGGDQRDPGRRPPPPRIPPVTDREYQDLKALLDDQAREDLSALTSLSTELAGDVVAVNDTLRTWTLESLRRNSPAFQADESTPLDRYRAREEPDVLDLLPPEEIMKAIYYRPDRRRGRR
ncbi:hypothetical protein Enr13x_29830 [Stieleria neptunia]|uniref:Zinc-finger domain-containing protein n=1 Tax=Stieleria neptunia TaxID=2527979 RepID=A0A518HQK0_9BACT|nr:hypothetical protein [Stieleria neptunia]QDV43129.1 hypothetical protein Enr13x_29830 [Stieleria neptunia]